MTENPPSCGHSGFAATTWVDDAGGSSWCRCCSGRGQHLMAVQPGDARASSILGGTGSLWIDLTHIALHFWKLWASYPRTASHTMLYTRYHLMQKDATSKDKTTSIYIYNDIISYIHTSHISNILSDAVKYHPELPSNLRIVLSCSHLRKVLRTEVWQVPVGLQEPSNPKPAKN